MASQVRMRTVSLSSVIRSPAFREGFNDYIKGKPPQFDRDWNGDRRKSPTDKAWAYERGRHFAAWFKGKGYEEAPRWFINKKLNWQILRLAADAQFDQAIR